VSDFFMMIEIFFESNQKINPISMDYWFRPVKFKWDFYCSFLKKKSEKDPKSKSIFKTNKQKSAIKSFMNTEIIIILSSTFFTTHKMETGIVFHLWDVNRDGDDFLNGIRDARNFLSEYRLKNLFFWNFELIQKMSKSIMYQTWMNIMLDS
jgi:hypothetical protein